MYYSGLDGESIEPSARVAVRMVYPVTVPERDRSRREARRRGAAAQRVEQRDLGTVNPRHRRARPARGDDGRLPMILLAILLLLGSVAASVATIHFHQSSNLLAASPPGPAAGAVVIVIDGAGPNDLAVVPTPHLRALENQGVTYGNAWVGQLENVGPVSNATISTGAFPARSGLTGRQWRDPKTGFLVTPTAPDQVQQGALDGAMETKNTTPLAALVKDRHKGATVLSAGGVGCADADAGGSWLADSIICPVRRGNRWVPGTVTGHPLPSSVPLDISLTVPVATGPRSVENGWLLGRQDDWITRYTVDAMRATHPALTVINYPEIRAVVPYLSGDQRAAALRTLVAGIDVDVGRIVAELKREKVVNRTAFVVTSDGAETSLDIRSPLSQINRAVVAAGGSTLYTDPGETTLVGLQDTLQGQPAVQVIQEEHTRGIDALYYKMRAGSTWTYTAWYLDPGLLPSFSKVMAYELSTMASAASPDVVVVGSPHAGFGPAAVSSSSLGAQWDTQHVPLIVAGHGVIPGVTSDYPARLVDVAPTVAALMGLGSPEGDGTALADAMEQAPDGASRAQSDAGQNLRLFVAALKAREQQRAD